MRNRIKIIALAATILTIFNTSCTFDDFKESFTYTEDKGDIKVKNDLTHEEQVYNDIKIGDTIYKSSDGELIITDITRDYITIRNNSDETEKYTINIDSNIQIDGTEIYYISRGTTK